MERHCLRRSIHGVKTAFTDRLRDASSSFTETGDGFRPFAIADAATSPLNSSGGYDRAQRNTLVILGRALDRVKWLGLHGTCRGGKP
jgi:hypothetical protein